MAYTEPTLKAKGDDPTLAQWQVYADNCTALVADAVAFRNNADHGTGRTDSKHSVHTFPHRGTWLVYATEPEDDKGNKSSAAIQPYLKDETVGEEITLPDAEQGGAFNLDEGVPWMVPGRIYHVNNVVYAFEVMEF